MSTRRTLATAAIALLTAGGCASWFAPKAKLRGHPLEASLRASTTARTSTFDHTDWAAVLAAAARPEQGRFDYAAVPRAALDRYLNRLASVDLAALPTAEQKALLINAYNALTVHLIVDQPTLPDSIRDLDDPWGTARWTVGGATTSLDDIEHALLRPIFRDPRLHFALNCASVGCPPLRVEPFEAATLDAQLDAATRDTLARDTWLRIDGRTLHVTPLLSWYGPDFTAEGWQPRADSVAAWLVAYGPPELAAIERPRVRFMSYDWRLNDVSTPNL